MCTNRSNYQPLVSVIVPVFNTEKYVSQCLDSIVNQSYPNMEVIIVDDGSTDDSASIYSQYAFKNSAVSVVQKKNGGLSSARNAGLSAAHGDYITFIDSDDYYLSVDAVSKLVEILLHYDVDISCCNYTSDSNNEEINSSEIITVYDRETAISKLLDDHGIRCFSCNKLFKRDIFADISFPEGKYFEDISTMYRIMAKVKNIAFYDRKLYFYRKRLNSITVSSFSEKNYDMLEAIKMILNDAKENHPKAYERLKVGYSYYYLVFINKAFASNVSVKKNAGELQIHINANRKDILRSDSLRMLRKFMVLFFGASPSAYKAFYVPAFRLFRSIYYEKDC